MKFKSGKAEGKLFGETVNQETHCHRVAIIMTYPFFILKIQAFPIAPTITLTGFCTPTANGDAPVYGGVPFFLIIPRARYTRSTCSVRLKITGRIGRRGRTGNSQRLCGSFLAGSTRLRELQKGDERTRRRIDGKASRGAAHARVEKESGSNFEENKEHHGSQEGKETEWHGVGCQSSMRDRNYRQSRLSVSLSLSYASCLCTMARLFRCESLFPVISYSYEEFITAGTAVRYVLDSVRGYSECSFLSCGIRAVLVLPFKVSMSSVQHDRYRARSIDVKIVARSL